MYSNINYDYGVFLSDEDESISSSIDFSDDEDNNKKFILGNNILHTNALEIISVRQVNNINESKENSTVKVSYESNGVHFDEIVGDLDDEEVSESDEYTDTVTEDLYSYHSNLDYELPKIDRFQSKFNKELHTEGMSKLSDIGEYCLQERSRRMIDKKEVKYPLVMNKSSTLNSEKNMITISNPEPAKSNSDICVVPNQVIYNLSIDVLTEFINSDKPLKEIVNKSKKQFVINNKKPNKSKNLKIKKNSTKEFKSKLTNEVKHGSVQVDSKAVIYSNNICLDIECQPKSLLDFDIEAIAIDNVDMTSNENSISSDSIELEMKTTSLLTTETVPCNTNYSSISESSNSSIDNQSTMINNPVLEIDNQPSSIKISNIDHYESQLTNDKPNVDNLIISFTNIDLENMATGESLDIFSSTIDKCQNSSYVLVKKGKQSIPKNNPDLIVQKPLKASSVFNSNKVSSTLPSVQNDSKKTSIINTNRLNQSKLSQNIARQPNKDHNFTTVVETKSILLSEPLSSNEIETNSPNNSRGINLKPKNQSEVLTNKELRTLDTVIQKIDSNSSSQNIDTNTIGVVKESSSRNQDFCPSKIDGVVIPADIRDTIFNSFNKISHYNFFCHDMTCENQSTTEDVSSLYPIKTNNKEKSVYEDVVLNDFSKDDSSSKESTTSSVDSGFHERSVINQDKMFDVKPTDTFHSTDSYCAENNNSSTHLISADIQLPVSVIDTSNINNNDSCPPKRDFLNENNIFIIPNQCNYTTDEIKSKKINPFKQNYFSSTVSVQSREEMSEFLNFQWLMFCEMHTLHNLI